MDENKIRSAFLKVKSDIDNINSNLLELKKEIKELRGLLRQTTPRTTPRTTPPNAPRKDLTSIEKKALNLLDSNKLIRAISHYIDEGYKTEQIKFEVMNRFNIKKTCFYKYLKIVREELRGLLRQTTPRTTPRKVREPQK